MLSVCTYVCPLQPIATVWLLLYQLSSWATHDADRVTTIRGLIVMQSSLCTYQVLGDYTRYVLPSLSITTEGQHITLPSWATYVGTDKVATKWLLWQLSSLATPMITGRVATTDWVYLLCERAWATYQVLGDYTRYIHPFLSIITKRLHWPLSSCAVLMGTEELVTIRMV